MHVAYRFKKAVSYYFYGMVDKKYDLIEIIANKSAPLEHVFGNHEFCTDQCPGKNAFLLKERYNSKTEALDKKMHRDIYLDLQEVTAPYFEPERLSQIIQENMPTETILKGTQGCEAVNQADCCMAPKARHYSSTCSLVDRSATMVATHNLGETACYIAVAGAIITDPLNTNQLAYLEHKWNEKIKRRVYESKTSTKATCTEQSKKSKLKSAIQEKMVGG